MAEVTISVADKATLDTVNTNTADTKTTVTSMNTTLGTVNTNVSSITNKLPSSNIADKSTLDTVNTNVTYIKNNMPSGGGDIEATDGSIKIDNGLWIRYNSSGNLVPVCTLPNVFCSYCVASQSTSSTITLTFPGNNISLPSTASSYEYVYAIAGWNESTIAYIYKCGEDLDGAPFFFFAPSFKTIMDSKNMGPDYTNNFSHWNTYDMSTYFASSSTGSNRYTKVTISGNTATVKTRNGYNFQSGGGYIRIACKLK